MDRQVSQMGNTILIAPEAVLPIVNKYFERISEEQWTVLAADECDPATEATLLDMITEIVESLIVAVVRNIVAKLKKHLPGTTSQEHENAAFEDYNVNLENCISDSFASALQIPQERCESAEKLTELVEKEVSQKVNSVLSEVTDNHVGLLDSTVYSFNLTSHQMVHHAIKCLGTLLAKVFMCCAVIEVETQEPNESPEIIKSKISVPSDTMVESDMLTKWSSESQKNAEEKVDDDESLSFITNEITSEIITATVDDQHKTDSGDVAECTESLPKPQFKRGLIFNKVRDFFSSLAAPSEDKTSNTAHKSCFGQEQFEKIMTELKNTFRRKKKQDMDTDDILPVAARPSHKFIPTTISTKVMNVNFETIKLDTDTLFQNLNQTKEYAPHNRGAQRILMVTGEIKKFSKDLTDKTYNHLIANEVFEFPIASAGSRTLSSKHRKDGASHEVLYTKTEEVVETFMQKVLVWMDKESSDKTSYSKELSCALGDIEDVIRNMLPPPEEDSAAYQIKIHVDNQTLKMLASPDSSESSRSESCCSVSTPESYSSSEGSSASCLEKTGKGLPSVSFNSSMNLTENLVTTLLMRIILEVSQKSPVQSADINAIITRLSDKVQEEVNIHDSVVRKIQNKMKKVNEAVVEDLTKEFGSSKKLLKAAMASNDMYFDDAVVKYLKIHLNDV
ncbi:hypothetical protein EXN66_Car016864 [Channa argus]|uniref:Uncharacterized protein n=1 Tax=Channa argus TaxID=215402 RepID=A0A6G1QGE5_CHAAH|nr:hypothetical protein EXN66_Car016864 [Channa argus]KAK2891822.1 hypothetical protein Q8A73_017487 [Channa argus]